MLTPLILALILSTLHLFSGFFKDITRKYHKSLLSFSAGVLITLIFLELIPRLADGFEVIQNKIYLFLLLGFLSFHLIEKEVCHHVHDRKKLSQEIGQIHFFAFFLEHFFIGIALVLLSTGLSFMIFVPFILLTISSSVLLDVIHKYSKSSFFKVFLASSTFLGALVATFISLEPNFYYALFSYITGVLIYIVARDLIPKEEKVEKTMFFILGVLITLIILVLANGLW